MPKYKEGTVTGETWRRSPGLSGSNLFGTNPTLAYEEEDIVLLGDGDFLCKPVRDPGSRLSVELSEGNALEQFQLRNPVTEEYIDAYATYQDLFVLVHSLYFHLAQERDKGPQPYVSWIWNDTLKQWEAPVPKPDEAGDWVWNEATQEWVSLGV